MRPSLDDRDLARLADAQTTPAARWIAGALTPANVVLALMAYLSVKYADSLPAAAAWWLAALVLVVGVPYLILYRALRKGTASDRQVVQRSQRPVLMASAATAVTIALVVLYVVSAPKPLVWLILAMICGLVAMALTTLVWKASMHLAVAVGAVAVLAIENNVAGLVAALFLPLLAWARWRDGRHSMAQLVGGAVIGSVVAGVVYGLLR
jgi:hypothetical protein